MHPLFSLQFVAMVTRSSRFKTLDVCLSAQFERHGTIFLYPENHIECNGRSIEVDSRWVRKVNRKYYFDPYMHASHEVPLVSGSQFGVFSGFPFPDEVLVGILGKSLLSGMVSGMTLGVVSRDRGLIKKCPGDWAPWVLKHELATSGSRAYSLHR